jgi:mannose-6-phosphate isomerase-like protein (cupin superfamily)
MLKKGVFVVLCIVLSAGLLMAGEKGEKGKSTDYGKQPWVVDIEDLTEKNEQFRATKWTGQHLQLTVMSIKPKGEIGLEKHDTGDQFIRVEEGSARVVMGKTKDAMTFDEKVSGDWAILIPAGYWHNIINVGDEPLKVYVLYGPPEHPAGTLHKTFAESEAAHGH